MAKRERRVPIITVILVLAPFLIIGFFAAVRSGYGCSVGRYLEASDRSGMVILGNAPVQMSNQTEWDLLAGLATGDKILVIHDGMDQSYPGRTGVYAVWKLGDGDRDDIPPTVVDSLIELGWLAAQ